MRNTLTATRSDYRAAAVESMLILGAAATIGYLAVEGLLIRSN